MLMTFIPPQENLDHGTAIVKGLVWLDLNRNGFQDNYEHGVEDVLIELHSLIDGPIIDATETGMGGDF